VHGTRAERSEVRGGGRIALLALLAWLSVAMHAHAVTEADAQGPAGPRDSPWLVVPIFSSDPKLGTSLGAMAAYLHKYDAESSVSMFGTGATYTSTHSKIGAVFARACFGQDHHRLTAFAGGGRCANRSFPLMVPPGPARIAGRPRPPPAG
jgi:hypothetical protein